MAATPEVTDAFEQLLAAAAERGARKALELHANAEPSTLIPIKSRPMGIGYRAILAAEKRGELRVHRKGKAAFVVREEIVRWITSSDTPRAEPAGESVAALIEFNQRRRRRRKAG